MPASRLATLLASGQIQALAHRAKRLMELQQIYLVSAPSALAEASCVRNFRAGILYLSAANAAVATKLRQLAPRLLIDIRKWEPEVTKIQVDVQVKSTPPNLLMQFKKSPLTAETIEHFRRLSDAVSDPRLKAAIARLVRRHGTKNPPR